MEISDLEIFIAEVPCTGPQKPVRSLLVRLAMETGEEGWGETLATWHPWELEGRRAVLLQSLGGRSIFDIEDLLTLEVLSAPPLRCAVEMASWDLIGRALGQPLCHLLGGTYRRRIPMAACLPPCGSKEAAQLAHVWADQGFYTQVVASAGRVEQDLETLAAVRQATSAGVQLQLDAAATYDVATAERLCAKLEPENLHCLIDPVAGSDLHVVAALGRRTGVPLAAHRAIHKPADVLAAARCGAVSLAILDLHQVGGILPARKCAAVAEAAGIQALLGGQPSLGVSLAAMLHVAASLPALNSANHCTHHQLQDGVLAEPLDINEGMIAVPQGPGLGVTIGRAKLERWQIT